MKIARWAAAAVLTLMSLLNLGAAGGDSSMWVVVTGLVLAIAGLAAVVGLVRRLGWGVPAALIVGAANLVAAVVTIATGGEGGAIGAVISAVGLVLTYVAGAPELRRAPAGRRS